MSLELVLRCLVCFGVVGTAMNAIAISYSQMQGSHLQIIFRVCIVWKENCEVGIAFVVLAIAKRVLHLRL